MEKEFKLIRQPLHNDIAYLKKDEIGSVICKGLAEVVKQRPPNPVGFLAKWLLSYQSRDDVEKTVNSF